MTRAVVDNPAKARCDRAGRAVSAIGRGSPVVVIDDVAGRSDGVLVFAAECATPALVAFAVRHGSGFVCVALLPEDCLRLRIPRMPCLDEDAGGPAYRVTVDAVGTGTGISAASRARTIAALAASGSGPEDFIRPGHVMPVRACPGGVLDRPTSVEAGMDLTRLAGRRPAAALTAVVSDDRPAEMAGPAELARFARAHGLVLVSTTDLVVYRRRTGC
ncbi:3,4-dihydroxy-2-butanone-4-phosphate synthase [Amycolatopsis dongchuanensis]|uniref:3,4-dihydroxy-2-butanone-4-phosphate synthase n=1 Tax=Amycolatopsis dongchuanensis TaxID=1070866 RepID=A0ABP8VDR1_9PSEU